MFVQVHHLKGQEFWCSECDCELVKSNDKTTGNFYSCHGHTYDGKSKQITNDWPMVVFALCSDCLKIKDNLFR